MGYQINYDKMEEVLTKLKERYSIYAPKQQGNAIGNEMIRYNEINSIHEIVHNKKANFSPKEVFYPIIQSLLYFKEGTCTESELKQEKDILIFARPCDINGIKRLDQIFLKNGGQADNFYQRRRDRVKLVLMECSESWETCFCVSMGTNQTEDYSLAIKFKEDGVEVEAKDEELAAYFTTESPTNYQPAFVMENEKKVQIPKITNRSQVKDIIALDYWRQFDDTCIGCGGCNTTCISCSCFDTVDVIYDETSMEGERRRVWSSCMLKDFTTMAGGHSVRSRAGDRMRFKALHKFYDYNYRFDLADHMCVGCGRCDMRCPKEIRFSEVINGLSEAVEQLKASAGKETKTDE